MTAQEWRDDQQITAQHLNDMIKDTKDAADKAEESASIARLASSTANTASTTVSLFDERIRANYNSIVSVISDVADLNTRTINLANIDATVTSLNNEIRSACGTGNNLSNKFASMKEQWEEYAQNYTNSVALTVDKYNNLVTRINQIDGGPYQLDEINGLTTHIGRIRTLEDQIINNPSPGQSNIKSNVAALITEVEAAHRQNNDTLDARFDDIDYEISHEKDTQNENDLGGLVQQLAEVKAIANSAASATEINARLDAIDDATNEESLISHVNTIATELGMIDTNGLKSVGTRVDEIAAELLNAKDSYNSIDERFDAIENTVSNNNSALDARLDAIDGGTTLDTTNGTLANRISAAETAINTKVDSATMNTALESKADVATVNAISTTIVLNNTQVNFDLDNKPTTLVSGTIVDKNDYLIQSPADNKYYYWKHINNEWHLMGGAASSGESNVVLPDNIINSIGVQTVSIDNAAEPDKWPTNEQFSGGLTAYANEDSEQENNLLENFVAVRNARIQTIYDENDEPTAQKLQVLDTNGKLMEYDIIGGGGSGTANLYNAHIESSTQASRSIPTNNTDPVTIVAKVIIQQGNSLLNDAVAEGTIQYRKRGTTTWNTGDRIEVAGNAEDEKYIIANNTNFTIDITKYLEKDAMVEFRIVLIASPTSKEEDQFEVYSSIFRVTQVTISIIDESFDYGSVKNSNFQFNYRCFGSGIAKTVHFLLDNVDIVTPVSTTSHNTVLQQIIPMTNQQNGMHTFQVYFVTNTGLESNRLNYYILYNTDSDRQAPLIGAAAEKTSIIDGDELIVNYSVSTVGSETTDRVEIELYTMDNDVKNSIQTDVLTDVPNNRLMDPPYTTFNYPRLTKANVSDPDPDPITVYVTFTAYHGELSDSQTVQVSVNYLKTNYRLEAEGENNLLYSYTAYGHSNKEANKEVYNYTFTNVSGNSVNFTGTFNNFNWSTDGYVDGKSLTIGGGATLNINVPIFTNQVNNISLEENADTQGVLTQDITKNGRTIEIDYEVQSATNLNDIIMNCMTNIQTTTENGIITTRANGFQVTPQNCYLLNSSVGVEKDSSGFILNEDQIAAAYLSPGQRIHLVFVIEPWATDAMRDNAFDGEYHQSVNIYVNGEFANTCPYNRDKITGNLAGNDFSTNATITIGSDSCLIKLYSIKLYNRGLTESQVLQNYKVAPVATRDKLVRLQENDILNNSGLIDYEKARTKYNCLLLTGPAPVNERGEIVPTISPFKGAASPAGRRDSKTNEVVGKTESGLTLTKPSKTEASGYTVEFDLRDTVPTDQSVDVPSYIGARGAYCSSNNVQGTSSQKYPLHNLKIYLAKWQAAKEAVYTEDENTHEQVLVSAAEPAQIKKVKYCLKGKDEHGVDIGTAESTLCWKADYMSTDHANTFNANIADGLFKDKLLSNWESKHYQNTVYGIRCLLFQKQGDNPPEFIGDGCLNNDKGNSKTYGLEDSNDDGNDTRSQKWEFTNNSEDLGYFKTDDLFAPLNGSIRAKNGFESCYPDEGDLKDDNLEPNYNHLQVLLTWVSKRANYWDETNPDIRASKKAIFRNEFTNHFNLNHVLTYYLFLEYAALCDNRVKNMFLRSDNVKEEVIRNSSGQIMIDGNAFPDDDPTGTRWASYVNTTTGVTVPSEIDWEVGEGHSNFAIWAPVLYDLDSCFGVENVGLIKIRYDANWDYEWKGTPQFNGYNSIFWLMVEDTFKTELASLAVTLYNQNPGLNFRTFNQQQIIENQKQISPALTNQDMILKFDKPWSEGFINYAETPDSNGNYPRQTPLYKYLQRGSRAAQKSQFMQQRSMLLSSYYGAAEFLNNSIKFRTGVPVGASGNIIGYTDEETPQPIYGNGDLTETQITLKANQILYPGVAYGDNKPATRVLTNDGKVLANTTCTIQATSAVQGNDGIFIYGASVLTDIGDISKFKPLQLDVSAGINLKRLIIGSNANGYENNTTNSITGLNKCVLLEEINVRNLKQMSTLTLTSNGFIKEVYAAGSGIGTISLPQGGVLETIEYSENTTDITIINQSKLTNFTYENSQSNHYGNVTRLWFENTSNTMPNVPIVDIIKYRANNLTNGIRLIGIDIELDNDPTFLEIITSDYMQDKYLSSNGSKGNGLPQITGRIGINEIRASLLNKVRAMYGENLIIDVHVRTITENKIEFWNEGTLYKTFYLIDSETIPDPTTYVDPITQQVLPLPTKESDMRYSYTYNGWRYVGGQHDGELFELGVYATTNYKFQVNYATTPQYYNLVWQDNGATIARVEGLTYDQSLVTFTSPSKDGQGNFRLTTTKAPTANNGHTYVFKGWDKALTVLNLDNFNLDNHTAIVNALWEESTIDFNSQISISDFSNLNAADLYGLGLLNGSTRETLLENYRGSGTISFTLGHDFDYTNVDSTDLLQNRALPYRLTGDPSKVIVYNTPSNGIYPLKANESFTLALDFTMLRNVNQVPETILASCYYNNSNTNTIHGFKIAYNTNNHQLGIYWGNASPVIIDNINLTNSNGYRNIVVLSHLANSNNLNVYYRSPDSSNTLPGNVIMETLSYTYTPQNIPFILGGNYAVGSNNELNTTTIEKDINTRGPATSDIHFIKYWHKELRSDDCMALASWPHENIEFVLTGYDNGVDVASSSTNVTITIGQYSKLNFASTSVLGDRGYNWSTVSVQKTENNGDIVAGWNNSSIREYCNTTIYSALPTTLQSALSKNKIPCKVYKYGTVGSNFSGWILQDNLVVVDDYIYLPSAKELGDTKYNEAILSWPLAAGSDITVYEESQTAGRVEAKSITTEDNNKIQKVRFYSTAAKFNKVVFKLSSDPKTNAFYDNANTRIVPTEGNYWYDIANNIIYIYSNDKWEPAIIWSTRTFTEIDNYANIDAQSFKRISSTGILSIPSGQNRDSVRGICIEFAIGG